MAATYLPLTQAAHELGVSPRTLTRRFRSRELTIFRDPRDLRRRLIRRDDLEAAFGPPTPTRTPPRLTDPGLLHLSGTRRLVDR